MNDVRSIVVTVSEDLAEIVTDRMWQWGVQAVSEERLRDGRVEIATSVGNDDSAIARAVATLDTTWPHEIRASDATVSQVAPEFLSPTWYAPNMVSVPAVLHPIRVDDTNTLVTVIDPGSAFGLGDHPTTQTSMALLAGHLTSSVTPAGPRTSLLDVGCGTGALAVLAAQLGVPHVRAIDIADAAVEATTHNAELNSVADRIVVDTTPVADLTGRYDTIAANILAPVLVSMAPHLRRLLEPDGSLIVSGILADRHEHVLTALAPLRPVDSMRMNEWITIRLR